MNTKLENIRLLVMREILGTITDEEREELSGELDKYPEARMLREDLHRVLATEEVQNFVKQQAVIHPAEAILHRANGQRRRRRNQSIAVLSAAAAFIAFFAIKETFYKPTFPGKVIIGSTVVEKQDIQLAFADGRVVDLSAYKGRITAGDAVLTNINKILTYTSRNTGYATLTVPGGKDYNIHLSDGSEVQLNAGTSIRFPLSFTGDKREVFIDGEAFFNIAKDAGKPFIVHVPNGVVRVLGTQFNVNSYDSGIVKVALLDGAVKFEQKEKSVQLKPGQECISSVNNITTHLFDESDVLSWRLGRYMFNDASLEEICRVMPRLYGVPLVLDSKKFAARRFTGVIDRNEPLENVLKALKVINEIDYYADKEGVFHIK